MLIRMVANVCVWNYNFYGRGCCDSRDHGDPPRLPMPVSDPDTIQTDTVIFSEFNWKIVFSKITSRVSKPLSVFDKLGLGSKYRGWGGGVSPHRVEKKMQRYRGCPN